MWKKAQIIDAIAHRAVNDATRTLVREGCDLTHEEADELGEAAFAWVRTRLGLTVTETDSGVEIRARVVGEKMTAECSKCGLCA